MRQVELLEAVDFTVGRPLVSQPVLPDDFILGLLVGTNYLVEHEAVIVVEVVCRQIDLLQIHRLGQTGQQNLQNLPTVDAEVDAELLQSLIL